MLLLLKQKNKLENVVVIDQVLHLYPCNDSEERVD